MGRIRVLMWMVPEGSLIPGGHQVQLRKTAEALRELGVDVVTTQDVDPDLSAVDVVHGFGIPATAIRAARRAGVPVVLSPIYWSRDYTAGLLGESRVHKIVRLARLSRSCIARGPIATAERMLAGSAESALRFESADLLLPNSGAEGRTLQRELHVTTPMHVVPNAVDDRFFTPGHGDRAGVLCVARFEPHKNQLGLIRALRGTGLRLTLAGATHPHHPGYLDACRQAADSDTVFAGRVSEEELRRLYRTAQVHVLASLYETTGLSSLEAALCGCQIVTTDRGFASEYFASLANYCDPNSERSIRSAVESAIGNPLVGLRDRILANYTWTHTAKATLEGYEEVLHSATDLAAKSRPVD